MNSSNSFYENTAKFFLRNFFSTSTKSCSKNLFSIFLNKGIHREFIQEYLQVFFEEFAHGLLLRKVSWDSYRNLFKGWNKILSEILRDLRGNLLGRSQGISQSIIQGLPLKLSTLTSSSMELFQGLSSHRSFLYYWSILTFLSSSPCVNYFRSF